jgi:hypothetical protein
MEGLNSVVADGWFADEIAAGWSQEDWGLAEEFCRSPICTHSCSPVIFNLIEIYQLR